MSPSARRRVIILGAAGRDFHDFNVFWRNSPDHEVVAFTAEQIPGIVGRTYPPSLAGPNYPKGVPIHAEEELESLIRSLRADEVVLAYSDLSHEAVMNKASRALAAGADFRLLGWKKTMLASSKPVVAVCAVRTGCGKSQTSRYVTRILRELGRRVAVVRHPMPYGDIPEQVCQRFATVEDLHKHKCTIEEREEYEPHLNAGSLVFAGVDYERILRAAEAEADVILWDGGNNDLPFFRPDLHIVVTDPHRAGHEHRYHPGETNLRMADVVVVNKCSTADPKDVRRVQTSIAEMNPGAVVVLANSPVTVSDPDAVKGKRVLVLEDGPTLTHGEMAYGAGHLAARQFGAKQIVDPRPYAQGSIRDVYAKYTHLTDVLPAMGYGDAQIAELEATINQVPCDAVLIGTPIDLARLIKIKHDAVRVTYELEEQQPGQIAAAVKKALSNAKA
jgi:predicted GTPase